MSVRSQCSRYSLPPCAHTEPLEESRVTLSWHRQFPVFPLASLARSEFLQVTTGKGTELSLTTFCTSVLSVTGKRISDYNCVCGHFSPKVSLLPLFQSYVSNIQKDSLWSSAGLTLYFWSEICFDIYKVTWASFWLVFSWYDMTSTLLPSTCFSNDWQCLMYRLHLNLKSSLNRLNQKLPTFSH